ncbi:alcohol dehydrogenase [Ophiostoma piceae UAMH 11346]|uniref:Alcohol dehydrogenase n=1 Tax=Ophiostoma piceae (strain UAMH 11346) TaxID=1262450 RepID=S3CJA3_OPHP1|nr:alcohol dehydrogenase [Ophiostoma piceae UAMH 11346]
MYSIVAPTDFTDPAGYASAEVARPEIKSSNEVLIRVHAGSVNPVDVKKADGIFKMAITEQFPYQIGYDAAGVIEATGPAVRSFKVGDEIYVRLPEVSRGSWSEYAVCADDKIALKPKSISLSDAASLPLAATTALQSLQRYRGSLKGKTVFVPAGLGGTGAYACQLAKNVFGAGKVITTVSTSKIAKVPEFLGDGVVDQIIDYTKEDPIRAIPQGSVDFLFDTTGQSMAFLGLMTPKTSMIVSIATAPSGSTLQASGVMQRPDKPRLPLVGLLFLNAGDAVRRVRAWRWGVEYLYLFMEPSGENLKQLAGYVDEGKLRPVVGSRVDIRDIKAVRDACMQVYKGKGGIGKAVLEFRD